MATRVVFDVTRDTLTPTLARVEQFGRNPFAFLNEVGERMVESTKDRFENQVSPDGQTWKQSKRAESTPGALTLKQSGTLFDGLTHNASSDDVQWGSAEVYAAIHQFGGQTGRNGATTLDERAYLGINDDDEQIIEETFEFFFADAAGL